MDIELLCASFSLIWNAHILKAAYLNWGGYSQDRSAWLAIVFTPIKELLKTTHFSCLIFFDQLNNFNRYHKSCGCGPSEIEHSKRYQNHFLTAQRYDKHAIFHMRAQFLQGIDELDIYLLCKGNKLKRKRQRSSLSRMLPTLNIKLQM